MKLAVLYFLLAASATVAWADEVQIQQLPTAETPAEMRMHFIERYLDIHRTDWKVSVSPGNSVTFILHKRFADKPLLEFQVTEDTPSQVFLVTAPDPSSSQKLQITFGNQARAVSTFIPKPESWRIEFGVPDGIKYKIFSKSGTHQTPNLRSTGAKYNTGSSNGRLKRKSEDTIRHKWVG